MADGNRIQNKTGVRNGNKYRINRKAKQRENKTAIQVTALLTGHQAMTDMTIIMMTGMTMICRRKKETGSVEPEGRFYKKINGNIGEKFNLNVKNQ